MSTVDEIERLFAIAGDEAYGEQVTMAEHMLLTAQTAADAGAPAALVAASLLHDIGHLLVDPDDEYGNHAHAEIGAEWVAARFPPSVSEPIRRHVDAKRYLCATEPDYWDKLSDASRYTLGKQGGPMNAEEAAAFEHEPYWAESVQLRRWEDGFGKSALAPPPDFEAFRLLLQQLAHS